jgi:hypothetical protein
MTTVADAGSRVDADWLSVVIGCVAVLVIFAVAHALRHTAPPVLWLGWQRVRAAGCVLCDRPVTEECQACGPCRRSICDAFRAGQPYDQEA